MRAIVVANCTTQTYVEGLQKLFPQWEVRGVATDWAEQWLSEGSKPEFHNYLKSCQLYVGEPLEAKRLSAELNPAADKIIIPPLHFRGLHPDIAVVSGFHGPLSVAASNTQCSLVALAARSLEISVEETLTMFCMEIYQELGYFDLYAAEKRRIIDLFQSHNIDLSLEFEDWEKVGDYFHVCHHPRAVVLIDVLRRALAGRFLNPEEFAASAHLGRAHEDNLANLEIWPVYPEIAAPLGFQGSLTWVRPTRPTAQKLSLRAIVEGTFSALDAMDENWRAIPFVKRAAHIMQDYRQRAKRSPAVKQLDIDHFGGLDGAEKDAVQAALELPADPVLLVQAQLALLRSGKFKELDALYDLAPKMIQYDQGAIGIWCMAARLRNDWLEALRRAERFVSLYPDEAIAYTHMIFAVNATGGFEEAIHRANQWMEKFPDEKEVIWPAANIAFTSNQWQIAESLFIKLYAVQKSELNDASWRMLILSLKYQGKNEQASKALNEALNQHPNSPAIGGLVPIEMV